MAGATMALVALALTVVPASVAAAAPTLVWSVLSPPTAPPPLQYASATYDGDNHTLVLFGGALSNGSVSGATWIWNGSTWAQSSPALAAPVGRTHAALAFDPAQHQLILFGGIDSTGQLLDDTWAWNGQSWTQLSPAQSPSARDGAAIAADPSGGLVLFGGMGSAPAATAMPDTTSTTLAAASVASAATSAGSATVLGDTWTWSGTTWAPTSTTGPPARTAAALSTDSSHHQAVLFGGLAGGVQLDDTWTWNGSAWVPAAPTTSPPARVNAVFADDPTAGGPILFGGSRGTAAQNDSWLWDGASWQSVAASTPPPARAGAAAGADIGAGHLVVFGGVATDGTPLGDTQVLGPQPVTATPKPAPSPLAPTNPTRPGGTTTTTRPNGRTPAPSRPTPSGPGTTPTTLAAPPVQAPAVRTVAPGSLVTLLGNGFAAHATITITFHSTPSMVGRTTADGSGQFSATVAVPVHAAAGEHRFVASGPGPEGTVTRLVTTIMVSKSGLTAGTHHDPWVTPIMIGISILIPIGTYAFLALRGRRRVGQPAS